MADPVRLQKAAINDLAQSSVSSVVLYPVLVLGTAGTSDYIVDHRYWVLGIAAACLLIGFARWRASRKVIEGVDQVQWGRILQGLILVQGLLWSSYVLSAVEYYHIALAGLVPLVVSAAVAVESWATLSSSPRTLQLFVAILMLPSALLLCMQGPAEARAGLAYCLAAGVLLANGRLHTLRYWKSLNDTLALEDARAELAQALAQAVGQKEELSHKNAELDQARRVAEKASKTKSEFLAVMSHELRTPLNGVLGAVQVLLDEGLPPQQTEMANIIRSSGESLLTLISDILDFSRIESSKVELRHKRFALSQMVGETIALFAKQAHEKGVRLSYHPGAHMPSDVAGDNHRLKQVLSNLVGNALKFTQSGTIKVKAEAHERRRKLLLHFTVSDTGVGISQAHMGELFEAFTQVDSSLARRHGGAGLGLAVATRLCAIMDGRVWVVSGEALGGMPDESLQWERKTVEGTTFHFTVSMEGVLHQPSPPTRESDGQFQGLRVLLAEDNEFNQQIATRFLQRMGCHVELAVDGEEVLRKVADGQYEVVFMDLHMPILDGLETTERLRATLPAERQPWVVALTASARAEDRERCERAGMNDFVTKPIRREELARSLANRKSQPIAR